jgi:hypothetical protein
MHSTPAMQSTQALEAIEAIEANSSFPMEGTRPRRFCLACEDGEPRCPTCAFQGEHILLDYDQTSDLFDTVYSMEELKGFCTKEQVDDAMETFRVLLLECAPWYDKTSLQMIQACYQNLCMRGGTSKRAALAIHFFEKEYDAAKA